ncbi:MAG: NHL repeat-containing protein [bacterium]
MKDILFLVGFLCSFLLGGKGEFLIGQVVEQKPIVQYLTTWGERGTGPGQFRDPQGISVDPSGFLYVADTGNQRIQKFDQMGRFMVEIGGFGWGREQFNGPVSVSARNGLDVFVADYFNQRVERYDKDLHYLASFMSSEEWSEHLRFGFPKDADLSPQGELLCLDGENRRVLKLDVLGNPQRSFGDFDAGEGRLVEPQRIAVSKEGIVAVSDWEGGRVVAFDIHGNPLFILGEGILGKPAGMAGVDGGVLFVADVGKKRVFLFQGIRFVVEFSGDAGMGIGFEEPIDVAVWRDRVYVLDRKKNAVHVFRWDGIGGSRRE